MWVAVWIRQWLPSNVTRFDEISSLWEHLKFLDDFMIVYLVFGKTMNLLWQNNYTIWHVLLVVNLPNIEKYSNHLVTLFPAFIPADPVQIPSTPSTLFHDLIGFDWCNCFVFWNCHWIVSGQEPKNEIKEDRSRLAKFFFKKT